MKTPHTTATQHSPADWPPVPGTFLTKLVKGGPWCAAAIRRDARGWWVEINGRAQAEPDPDPNTAKGLHKLWQWGRDCTQADYDHHLAVFQWAIQHAPDEAEANPSKAVDLKNLPPIF